MFKLNEFIILIMIFCLGITLIVVGGEEEPPVQIFIQRPSGNPIILELPPEYEPEVGEITPEEYQF